MSTTITRTVATGTITVSEQLQLELSAAPIGTVCEAVGILVGVPNNASDTLELVFAAAPDETEVDAVIAAHPTYTYGIPTSVNFTADTWVPVWSMPLASRGQWVHLDSEIHLRIGDETDMRVSTLYAGIDCKRLRDAATVEMLSGLGGAVDVTGEIPLAQSRFVADSEFVRLQVRIGETSSASVDGHVEVEAGEVFP